MLLSQPTCQTISPQENIRKLKNKFRQTASPFGEREKTFSFTEILRAVDFVNGNLFLVISSLGFVMFRILGRVSPKFWNGGSEKTEGRFRKLGMLKWTFIVIFHFGLFLLGDNLLTCVCY